MNPARPNAVPRRRDSGAVGDAPFRERRLDRTFNDRDTGIARFA
jgi:hypothetical protein